MQFGCLCGAWISTPRWEAPRNSEQHSCNIQGIGCDLHPARFSSDEPPAREGALHTWFPPLSRRKVWRLFQHPTWALTASFFRHANQEVAKATPAAESAAATAVGETGEAPAQATEVIKGDPLLHALLRCSRQLTKLRHSLLVQVRSGKKGHMILRRTFRSFRIVYLFLVRPSLSFHISFSETPPPLQLFTASRICQFHSPLRLPDNLPLAFGGRKSCRLFRPDYISLSLSLSEASPLGKCIGQARGSLASCCTDSLLHARLLCEHA